MSNYVKSTNFAVKDSLATGDPAKKIVGTDVDTEFNNIATAVNSKANAASAALTGTPTAPTATAGTSTTQIATTAFVTTATASSIPTGVIVLWSGAASAIPSGWLLCNGSSSTPDLRDKFVLGAGSSYAVGATGGSKDAIAVSHTHTLSTDGAHTHTVAVSTSSYGADNPSGDTRPLQVSGGSTTTSSSGDHTHTVGTTGSSGTNANLPPYYALCYIMKA